MLSKEIRASSVPPPAETTLTTPLGGILIALFVGWRLRPELIREHLAFGSPVLATAWLWLLRVIAPLAILGVLISSLN